MTKILDDDEDLSFPKRETPPIRSEGVSETESDSEEGSGEGVGDFLLTPPWFLPEPGVWIYNPYKKILSYEEKNKKISLSDLKTPEIIIKLLAALEEKDLNVDDLIIALQDASYDCYQISLPKLLTQFKGKHISWEKSDHLLKNNINL